MSASVLGSVQYGTKVSLFEGIGKLNIDESEPPVTQAKHRIPFHLTKKTSTLTWNNKESL